MCQDMAEPKEANIETEGGLVFLPSDGCGTANETDLCWKFGTGANPVCDSDCLALEKPLASNLGKLQTDPDVQMKARFCESTDIELEWQWVTDQQQKDSKCRITPLAQSKNACVEIANEDVKEEVHDALEEFTKYQQENESSEMIRGNAGSSSVDQLSQADLNGKQTVFRDVNSQGKFRNLDIGNLNGKQTTMSEAVKPQEKSRSLSMELNASKLKHKNTGSWRTADRMELADLLFQKSLQCLENCDLPSSQSSFTYKESLTNCDLTPSKTFKPTCCRSINKGQVASTVLEKGCFPSSPMVLGTSDPLPLQKYVLKTSQALTIPTLEGSVQTLNMQQNRYLSLDDRDTGWNGRGRNFSGCGDTLGEALCHSQTRAREAEQAVAQAIEEKEHLVQLIFRESSLSLAYKQWVRLLEIENTWLKMHARYHPALWMEHAFLNPAVAFEQLSNNHWKHLGRKFNQQHA